MKTNRAPFPTNYALMRVLFCPVVAQLRKVHGSNIQWRGRFYGVAVASDIPKDDRRKRIPKAERKSMVESYVKKCIEQETRTTYKAELSSLLYIHQCAKNCLYRVVNAGKFPTVSDAQKQVGGSYYVVRAILQELQHNSNLIPVVDEKSLLEQPAKESDISAGGVEKYSETPMTFNRTVATVLGDNNTVVAEEFSSSRRTTDARFERDLYGADEVSGIEAEDLAGSWMTEDVKLERDYQNASINHLDSNEGESCLEKREEFDTFSTVGKTPLKETVKLMRNEDDTKFLTASSPVLTAGNGRVPRTCKEVKVVEADEASSDDFLKPNVSSTKPIHDHASTGFDGLSRDTSLQTTKPNVPQKKLSFWESLRSFAGNIISGWRKS